MSTDTRPVPFQPEIIGWPTLYQPSMGYPVQAAYLRRSSVEYTWFLAQRYWTFQYQLWRQVQLKQVPHYDSSATPSPVPTFNTLHHYYFPRGDNFPPCWDSCAVNYNDVTDIDELHDIGRHPQSQLVWRMTFLRYDDQEFHPGPGIGQIDNTLVLYLWNLPTEELVPDHLWYVDRPAYTPRIYVARAPLTFISTTDAAPITVYPLGP